MAYHKGKGSGRELLPGSDTSHRHRGPWHAPKRGGEACHTLWCSGSLPLSGVPGLLSRSLVVEVAGGSFCVVDCPWGNGWTPPITLLQSTRQLVAAENFPSFPVRSRQNHEKLRFFIPETHFGSCNAVPWTAWNRLFLLSLNSCSKVLAGQQGPPSQTGCQAEWFGSASASWLSPKGYSRTTSSCRQQQAGS